MLKEPVVSVLEQLKLALWVEVVTEQPQCTYYFGPCQLKSRFGYIEDLKQESAQVIAVTFNRVQPRELTNREGGLRISSPAILAHKYRRTFGKETVSVLSGVSHRTALDKWQNLQGK